MRRYNHSADFTLNHLAEKVPIHYRSSGSLPNRKGIAPATAFVHDLAGPEFGNRDDDIGGIRMTKSAPLSPNAHKPPVFLPGDRVIFAESPSAPGIPVVYRTPEERTANPDRLNLDRRRLSVCPILEGEDQLRLLNYQHNLISKIQHLAILRRLIFLDLYDNQIEEICGLSMLKSLRVLMLGKNRIKTIENLDNLMKLDVLDLHGNQIKKIQNLSHLTELRVLNLAGNQIMHVDDLSGLDSLAELNLRRNSIKTVIDVDNLLNLQRLFLSFNEISSFDDIACLGDSNSISELSLDGNPIAQDQYYKQIILRRMQQLKQLDMKRISEEERRIAMLVARKEEDKKRELTKTAIMKEKRRLAINNAKRQWEVNQGTLINKSGKLRAKMPDLYASHLATYSNPDLHSISPQQDMDDIESNTSDRLFSRPTSAHSARSANPDGSVERSRPGSRRDSQSAKVPLKETKLFGSEGDVSNLADLNGDTLSMYGQQSLEALDKNWGIQAAGAVTTLVFKFINFDDISKHLHKIRTRFPGVQTLIFSANSISTLQQLNALSNVRRLDNLTLETDGNPVTKFVLWKMYILFRLAHFAMKKINDVEVTASDIVNAEKLFGPLSHITTSQLPQSRLLSLLGETRKKHLLNFVDDKGVKKTGEGRALEKMQGEFVGRAGLIYYPPGTHKSKLQEQQPKRTFGRNYVSELIRDTIFTEKKRTELIKIWPQMFYEMVHNAVTDMEDLQAYMKKCTEELEKG